jgi:hypothetical protein
MYSKWHTRVVSKNLCAGMAANRILEWEEAAGAACFL